MKSSGLTASEAYVIARWAYEYALQGAYDSASILLEGLLAAQPGDRYAAVTLAAVRLKQGRTDESGALLEALRRRNPRDVEATGLLVEARLAAGRLAEAERLIAELGASGTEVPERLVLRLQAARSGIGSRRLEG